MKNKNLFNSYETAFICVLRLLDGYSGFAIFWLIINICMKNPSPLNIYRIGTIIFVFILIFFHFHNIYRSFRFSTLRYEIHMILTACFFVFILLFIMGYITGILSHIPRRCIIAWTVFWPGSIVIIRIMIRKLLRAFRIKGYNIKKAVIAGKSRAGMKLAKHIHNNPWSGTQVVGFFKDKDFIHNNDEPKKNEFSHGIPCLGDIEELKRYTENNKIDIIYVALNGNDEKTLHKLVKSS